MQLLLRYLSLTSGLILAVSSVIFFPFTLQSQNVSAIISIEGDGTQPPPPPPPEEPVPPSDSGGSRSGGGESPDHYFSRAPSQWFLSFSEDPLPTAPVLPPSFLPIWETPVVVSELPEPVVEEVLPVPLPPTPPVEEVSDPVPESIPESIPEPVSEDTSIPRESGSSVSVVPSEPVVPDPPVISYVGSVETPLVVSIEVLFSSVEIDVEVEEIEIEEHRGGGGFFSIFL